MNPNQPWRDTVCLLAGNPVRRSSRPGEQFEPPQDAPKRRRVPVRPILTALTVLLTLGIVPMLAA